MYCTISYQVYSILVYDNDNYNNGNDNGNYNNGNDIDNYNNGNDN